LSDETTTADGPEAPRSWRASSAFLVATLTIVSTINWADRQVVPILFPAIKGELGLSDTELGIVGGLAFSLIYAISSFVFGYLADRTSRRAVIAFGLVAWSLATAAGGLATGFWTLFAARFFTGVGEASLYPCAMSLIADTIPPDRRGRAIGIVGASAAVGGGLGIGLGGWLVDVIGWREVFFLYGAAGIALLPLLLLVAEPERPALADGEVREPPVQVLRTALGDKRLLAVWGSGMLMIAAGQGWVAWAPTYFVRELGWEVKDAGYLFGVAQVFGGVVGSLAGGRLGDAWRKKRLAGQLDVSALAALVAMPIVGLILFDIPHALLLVGAVLGPAAIFAYFPNLQTIVAEIVPGHRLGLTFAVHVLFLGGIGAAMGPFVIGALSDWTGNLRVALVVPLFLMGLAAFGAHMAGRIIRDRAGTSDPAA
jgi:MFS family permease